MTQPTADETRWLTDREQVAWRAMLAMWTRLNAQLAREMAADSDLSMADFSVLVALTDTCAGRTRAFSLAEALQWEKSRLSHQLARMEKRGLIERTECAEDGRGQIVGVTAAGRRAIEAAAPAHVAAVRRLFLDALTPDQLESLTEIARVALLRLDGTVEIPGLPQACGEAANGSHDPHGERV
ncbi:MarR family winged helix-turn-helix transcriptional regulator [Sporichthya polymorpha]|uniref:MarR family winged helix-turn-helix transcriptional regulator n=1 Tax=Sporichthya polymorpha TaxID=35751 RepID=UPI00037E212D|nr:MarR family winged helix-turn-helix transcriptional regulator [Sporichthya polymorpha]